MVTKPITPDLGSRRNIFGGTRSIIPQNPELVAWESRKDEAQEPSFEEIAAEWRKSLSELAETAKSNLYECIESLTHGDLWMHRLLVTQEILEMQVHILNHFAGSFAGKEVDTPLPPPLASVEKQMAELIDKLHVWHGSPETQQDVPDEFTESMEEALEGDVEDFDLGLNARSGGIK